MKVLVIMRWGINTAVMLYALMCTSGLHPLSPEHNLPLVSYSLDLQRLSTDNAMLEPGETSSFEATTSFNLPETRERAFTNSMGVALRYSASGKSSWNLDASDNLGIRGQDNMPTLRYHKQESALTYTRSVTSWCDLLAKAAYTRSSTQSPLIEEMQKRERVMCGGMGLSTEIVPQMWLAVIGEAVHLHNAQGEVSGDAGRLRFDLSANF